MKDSDFYRRIGALGGKKTVERHGEKFMAEIGRLGWIATTVKYFGSEDEHKEFLAGGCIPPEE